MVRCTQKNPVSHVKTLRLGCTGPSDDVGTFQRLFKGEAAKHALAAISE
jgi:hypothetical protein